MSQLIEEAEEKQTEQRYQKLDELRERESHAWQKMREEVLAEIYADPDDCRLSAADTSRIVDALSKRGIAAILFTFPSDAAYDISDEGKRSNSLRHSVTKCRSTM
jgi:hypothetical protein